MHRFTTAAAALAVAVLGTLFPFSGRAQTAGPGEEPLSPRERALLERVERLEARVAALERKQGPVAAAPIEGAMPQQDREPTTYRAPATPVVTKAEATPVLGGLGVGTTLNVYLDGYWGYNFNRPAGRVNLLRSNDVLSNSFSVNQLGLILERASDVAAGRRFGLRADLMFGQNTEAFQGSASNELRPQAYRNLFQAYGTYVVPIGSGLTVDFGKFYSSLGIENNYAYDEMNYSRSYLFNFLPFYHTGFRSTYNVNDKLSVQNWVVNGANQTEDFNGFKSTAFLFTIKPKPAVTWNVNYYWGQESRDLVALYNPTVPALATQPGLSTTQVAGRTPNGRTHIIDSYVNWTANQRLALAGEVDYVIGRTYDSSAPSHVLGGAGYVKYQLGPRWSVAARVEALSDRGGLFSGLTQQLKETTATATYQPVDGVQMRLEWRRDFSNQPYFLTEKPNFLKKEQNTATVGMVWWFGGKRESW